MKNMPLEVSFFNLLEGSSNGYIYFFITTEFLFNNSLQSSLVLLHCISSC